MKKSNFHRAYYVITWLFVYFSVLLISGCKGDVSETTKQENLSGKLVIFHAGSLALPFEQLCADFTRRHPAVRTVLEGAGSRLCARKICDFGKRCDVLATADSRVIKNLLMPEYAEWYIEFAVNEMVLVYNSDLTGPLTAQNLPEKLMQIKSLYRADPDLDPCGYRTLMVWQLMQRHYNHPGLYEKLLQLSPKSKIRPKETDILALWESSHVDAFFIYRSIAEQHQLPYLLLPDEVNLSNPALAAKYAQARVQVTGKQPGAILTLTGTPIVYGITIPANAPDPDLAREFVRFVLSPPGEAIMKANGQNPMQILYPADAPQAKSLVSPTVRIEKNNG